MLGVTGLRLLNIFEMLGFVSLVLVKLKIVEGKLHEICRNRGCFSRTWRVT